MKTSTFSIHKIIFMYKKTMVTYFPADFPLPMEVEKMVCELKWINPVKLLVCLQGSFFRVILCYTGGILLFVNVFMSTKLLPGTTVWIKYYVLSMFLCYNFYIDGNIPLLSIKFLFLFYSLNTGLSWFFSLSMDCTKVLIFCRIQFENEIHVSSFCWSKHTSYIWSIQASSVEQFLF